MDFNKICISCMKEGMTAQGVCSLCGFNARSYQPKPYTLPPFSILHGNYLVGKVLGEGGFGITYIGYDLTLNFTCAVKEFFVRQSMMRDSRSSSNVRRETSGEGQEAILQASYAKFLQEARTLVRLNKLSNIVKVYTCFEENGTAYFVMDYLGGPTLRQFIAREGGKISWNRAAGILAPAMQALQKLHEKDILHRDISPDNLMFDEEGEIYVLDFGGARQEFTSRPGVTSAISYMKRGYSPLEQVRTDEKQGAWTDVYAMAATFHFCLTGQAPVSSTERALGTNLVSPASLGAQLTRTQEKILEKGLALRAEDRYQTMGEFLDAVEQGRTDTQKPGSHQGGNGTGNSSGDGGGRKKTPLLLGLAAAVIIIAAVILIIALNKDRHDPEKKDQPETVKQETEIQKETAADAQQAQTQAPETQAPETQASETQASGTQSQGGTEHAEQKKDTYTVTVNGGSGSGEYKPGDRVTIKAETDDPDLAFTEWIVEEGMALPNSLTDEETYFFMAECDAVLTAHFESKAASQNGQNVWTIQEVKE